MKKHIKHVSLLLSLTMLLSTVVMPELMAQRKTGGAAPAKKPAAVQKPANVQRPAAKPQPAQKPSTGTAASNRNNAGNKRDLGDRKDGDRNISNNKVNIDKSRGDVNINVDNSKDIRVRNTRNTTVRHNTYRPYTRPPYYYGGYRYRCYHPYYYHPYRPFYWGPVWHPWGFFIVTLTTTAIIVSFADADLPQQIGPKDYFVWQTYSYAEAPYVRSGPAMNYFEPFAEPMKNTLADGEYWYDQGVFYLKEKGGYTVVAAPVGAIIKTLPSGYETVVLDEASGVKNYYWGGTFYEKVSNGYKVVPPTSGAVVQNLADGGEEVKMGDVTYVKLGETYYQPIQMDGKNVYEVVDVEADENKK